MATLSKAFAGYLNTLSHSSLVDYPCSFLVLHLSISEECGVLSPQHFCTLWKFRASSHRHSGLDPVSNGSGAGAGNPVSLGSSQQAMGWTGVFQGAALRLHWI